MASFSGIRGQILEQLVKRYKERTPKSWALHQRALRSMPEGDTRSAVYFQPYPAYIGRGEGCHVVDVDGNRYIDHLNNYTVQIHGHDHPVIREAAVRQLESGTSFGAPHEKQLALADILCRRVPSLQQVRFCNSGTEATMFAIRAARTFTGRSLLLKMEGIYNGSHENVGASVFPSLKQAGGFDSPERVPFGPGIPSGVLEHIVVAPFNRLEATEKIIEAHKHDLAAVIVEPVMTAAGVIPADPEYLEFLRSITSKIGALLIFDEVVTLRLRPGGAQEMYGITPDLTAMGKFIGGGMPVGAFGGRADIMAQFSPKTGGLSHSGTFNGHPVTMAAGVAAMNLLDEKSIERINRLGDLMRTKINTQVFDALGVRAQVKGVGSISIVHYTDQPVNNYRDARQAMEAAGSLYELVHLSNTNNGIWIAERGEYALSTPMDEAIIDQTVEVFKKTYSGLLPVIRESWPQLLK